MKEVTPQLAKCHHELSLKASEHMLGPLHCRPEEEMGPKKSIPEPFGSKIIFAIAVREGIAGLCLGLQPGHTLKAV